MSEYVFNSRYESETSQLGLRIGELLTSGMVVALNGTLGSGKTRLVKSIGSSLGIDAESVVSPTFTICVPHDGRLRFLHLDAYRINHLEEVDELGLDEEVERGSVLLIEWANKIEAVLPPIDLEIAAKPMSETGREYTVRSVSKAGESLVEALRAALADRKS